MVVKEKNKETISASECLFQPSSKWKGERKGSGLQSVRLWGGSQTPRPPCSSPRHKFKRTHKMSDDENCPVANVGFVMVQPGGAGGEPECGARQQPLMKTPTVSSVAPVSTGVSSLTTSSPELMRSNGGRRSSSLLPPT